MFYDAFERLRLAARDTVYGVGTLRNRSRDYVGSPLVVGNSFPKSGTHLLSQILLKVPGIHFWNDILSVQSLSGIMNDARHIDWKLRSAPPGSLVRAHLMYAPEVLAILDQIPVTRFFIYRDLRDVAVSHANWVLREPRIFLHRIYKQFPDFDSCLLASILGTPLGSPLGSNASQPDIGTDFRRWQGWLSDPDTMCVRFEDLVGERGQGDEVARLASIGRILGHLGQPYSADKIAAEFGSLQLNPEESHTFRKGNKGAIGGWRERFKDSHKDAFKRVAGDLLIELGYEKDQSW